MITLIAGGIGITPILPIIKYLKSRDKDGLSQQRIHLVWSIREPKLIKTFKNQINELLSKGEMKCGSYQSQALTKCGEELGDIAAFIIDIYCTSTEKSITKDVENSSGIDSFTMHHGRPDTHEIISNNVSCDDSIGITDHCVIMCGPKELLRDASNVCIEKGIDYHSEVFNW